MAISFRGTNAANFGGTGSGPTAVSGQTSGDFLFGTATSISGAFSALSGWTTFTLALQSSTGQYRYFAWRIADGTGTDTFAPTFAGGGSANVQICCFAVDTSSQPDGAHALTEWENTAAVVTAGNVTPTVADDMVVLYAQDGSASNTPSTPSGYTTTGIDTGSAHGGCWYKQLTGQSGVAQNDSVTFGGNIYGPVMSFLIKAAGGGGGGGVSVAWLRA